MSDFKIIGNPNPVVGVLEIYTVSDFFEKIQNSPFSEENSFSYNPVYWEVYVLEFGKWRKTKENDKRGNKVSYTFLEKSLTRNGIRILARKGDKVARLDIKPLSAQPKIDHIELLDKNGAKIKGRLSYGQTVKARVFCFNMERRSVSVTMWEDDVKGAGHNKANEKNFIETLSGIVKFGKADIDFLLKPSFAKIAERRGHEKDKSHEFYVTAEYKDGKIASNNINVNALETPVAPYKGKTTPHQPVKNKTTDQKPINDSQKPNVPTATKTVKGKINAVHITDIAGNQIKGVFKEKQIKVWINSTGLTGKEVRLKLYDDDLVSNDLLLTDNFTIKSDLHIVTVPLDIIPRSLGGSNWAEGNEQELFTEIEVLQTHDFIKSAIVDVDATVFKQDPVETTNKVLKVDVEDKKEKKPESKGKCYCNRDITADELSKMVKNIRDNTFYDGKTITFFHSDKLFYLYSNVPKSDRTFEKFAEAINKAFKKYEITTCARKIHFLANMYVETMYFTATREGKGTSGFRYDPYRGRGFQHLTWEDNYKKYKKETGIDIISDYEKVADDLNISADTGAWYWKKTGINEYADKDSIFDTSRLINYPGATKSSSINGYKDREIAWRELKKIFKFPFDCVSKKSINITSDNCPKCKVSHYDLTDKVEWQTQFDSKWGGIDAQNVACKKTCDDILNKQGLTSTSPTNKFQTALENSNHTLLVINTEESKRGIKYLDLQLKEGNPVQVGVNHALNYKGGKLNEGTTDHFVVIIGKSCENGKVYYRFYDVGTRNKSKGTSSDNRLYLDTSNYSLKGKTAYTNHIYTVTQIRNNKKG
ncbi:glycoside hydrolase family 19 protein [Flavobacterium sp. 2]|uniref:glycoside hydrolase family 19 protein n=1 Tax=Flavobacterium sp. 2 TaxID=308053 RepID=UPI003CE8CD08